MLYTDIIHKSFLYFKNIHFKEKEGFEPSVEKVILQQISNLPLSTTQPFLLKLMTIKWLWWDLNLRPWAYESPALTTELQSHIEIFIHLY